MPLDLNEIVSQVGPSVFKLDIPGEGNRRGSGFFISDVLALTAFHNLSESAREDATVKVDATLGGKPVVFTQELQREADRHWQRERDIVVLRATAPFGGAPKVKSYYLDPAWKAPERANKWSNRRVSAVGFPKNSDVIMAIPGQTAASGTLATATRVVGSEIKGTVPDALYFFSGAESAGAAPGLSGSALYDDEIGGIVGVVVAAGSNGLFATELSHVVGNWRDGKRCFRRFLPKNPIVYPEAGLPWRAIAAVGLTLALICLFAFWSYIFPPKELEIRLRRPGGRPTTLSGERVKIARGEKLQLLMTSPSYGYLYVVDREISKAHDCQTPFLVYPTLAAGIGMNKVRPGSVVNFPDESDRGSMFDAEPANAGDLDYAGEDLTVLVYDHEIVGADQLKPNPIPLDSDEFPCGGSRLLFVSPKAVRRVRLDVP